MAEFINLLFPTLMKLLLKYFHLFTNLNVNLIFISLVFTACNPVENSVRIVNTEWEYSSLNGDFQGKAEVPGTIHTDLLANHQIEDPFYRNNEKNLQWIDKTDWKYTAILDISAEEMAKDKLSLVFSGLDTYADVYLNDSLILSANNMFRTWEADISGIATKGKNSLKVYFHSPVKKGLEFHEKSGLIYQASNDQSENGGLGDKKVSIFTRKAGYHYGWDWGPRFVTSGIWRPVIVEAWSNHRFKDIYIQQSFVTDSIARLNLHIQLESENESDAELLIRNKKNGKLLASKEIYITKGNHSYSLPLEIINPELWWPAGYGEAYLYDFEVSLSPKGRKNLTKTLTTGLRDIKLVRDPDDTGASFYFEVNGIPIFAKGANYIPNDNFLPRVSREDYEKVIADAVNANMNMLRVWGGGIYENDYFYELCDKKGLLVWQDFMFACSLYPGDEAFIENVEQEAIDNVKRLRNHPSIALWCGNNEINTAMHSWGWEKKYSEEDWKLLKKAYLDVFHEMLPRVVGSLHSEIDYWPSSPQAGYNFEENAHYHAPSGDQHYWGVWHGLHPFENFDSYKARFMSEYGFQSFPDFESVQTYTEPQDYDIESEVMAGHQRSGIGNLRIRQYMEEDYSVPENFESFLYLSQVLQARGMSMGMEAHRRAMPYCMGTLYWQINDCWPVASWSSTDYYHKWKAMHYMTKKAYEPVILSLIREGGKIKIYGISEELTDLNAVLKLTVIDFAGNLLKTDSMSVSLKKQHSTLLSEYNFENYTLNVDTSSSLIKAELIIEGKPVSEKLFYFVKPKYQKLPHTQIETDIKKMGEEWIISLTSDKLARNVWLNFDGLYEEYSDNYFDLLPGETKQILVKSEKDLFKDNLHIVHLKTAMPE